MFVQENETNYTPGTYRSNSSLQPDGPQTFSNYQTDESFYKNRVNETELELLDFYNKFPENDRSIFSPLLEEDFADTVLSPDSIKNSIGLIIQNKDAFNRHKSLVSSSPSLVKEEVLI